MRVLNIGIIGVGVVGSAVIKMLHTNRNLISARAGVEFHVLRGVSRDLDRSRKLIGDIPLELSRDIDSVLEDENIHIVVELMGGIDVAYAVAKKSLQKKKAFVSANKAMLAYHRLELENISHGTPIGFEASVGGGIPIIHTLKDSLCSNHIQSIQGILNGTSNYILTSMANEGKDFASALTEAKKLGYAEADPSLDINGFDTGAKLIILASLAYGINVKPEDILIEGIECISVDDMDFAAEFGYAIKLLGIAKIDGDNLELRVHPTMLPKESMIAKVNGVMNAVSVKGDFVGESLYYGAGAGGEATASSVVADLIGIARDTHSNMLGFSSPIEQSLRLKPRDEVSSKYYVRLYAHDRPGVLGQIAQILGKHNISIDIFLQRESKKENIAKLLFSTHVSAESAINVAFDEIKKLECIIGEPYKIRIER